MSSFRDNSRSSWTGEASVEHINAGSLQRIADAAEKMAKNHVALMAERDRAVAGQDEARRLNAKLYRRVAALRGIIGRMKRKSGA